MLDDQHAVRRELDDLPVPGLGLAALLALGIQLVEGFLEAAQGAAEVADLRMLLAMRVGEVALAIEQPPRLAGQRDQRLEHAAVVEAPQHHHHHQQAEQHQHQAGDHRLIDLAIQRLDARLIVLMHPLIQPLQRRADRRPDRRILGAEQQLDGLLALAGIGEGQRAQLQGEQIVGAAHGLEHQRVVVAVQAQGEELLDGPLPRTDLVALADEFPMEARITADHEVARGDGQRLGTDLQVVQRFAGQMAVSQGVAPLGSQLGGQQHAGAGHTE